MPSAMHFYLLMDLHISEFASNASISATILNINDSPVFVMTVIFDTLTSFSSGVFIIYFKEMVTVVSSVFLKHRCQNKADILLLHINRENR